MANKVELVYAGQLKQARKWLMKEGIKSSEEMAMMSDSQVEYAVGRWAEENGMRVVTADGGQSVGLIPQDGCIWFER